MSWLNRKSLMLVYALVMNGALMVYLMLYHSSPGQLSLSHARTIKGTSIKSCYQCHTDQGLTHGCLKCHFEINEQINQNQGYHAYLFRSGSRTCHQCHSEHNGKDFPLVSVLSWQDQDPTTFNHSHFDFKLTGRHDNLTCAACHRYKRSIPFKSSDFPAQLRPTTYLGLSQDCINCHEDIHEGGQARTCDTCHDQEAFKPATHFRHNDYFALVGVHAQTPCSACHLLRAQRSLESCLASDSNTVPMSFKLARGKECQQCHQNPHRTQWGENCQTCHFPTDLNWIPGQCGINPQVHAKTGFTLDSIHANLACEFCHLPDRPYAERYPDPNNPGYARQYDNCRGCHQNPHEGNLHDRFKSCTDCHDPKRFVPRWWQIESKSKFH